MVELHYGTISAHNLEQGCEFVISLPLGSEHLKADEMVTEPDVETAEQLTLAEVEDSDETAEPIVSPNRQRPPCNRRYKSDEAPCLQGSKWR